MPTLKKNSPVIVTVLAEPVTVTPGRFLDLTGKLIVIAAPQPAGVGQPVQIEAPNMLWLGEVRDCQPALDEFELRVDIAHTLQDLAELARLNERFTGRSGAERAPDAMHVLSN